LLGGMVMPPTSEWGDVALSGEEALRAAPGEGTRGVTWEKVGEVRHVFTHFALRLDVWRGEAGARTKLEGLWVGADDALAGLPTVGRKAVALALGGSGPRTARSGDK